MVCVYVLFLLYALVLVVFFITRGNLLLSVKATIPLDFLGCHAATRERVLVSLRTVYSSVLGSLTVKYWSHRQETISRHGLALFVTFFALLVLWEFGIPRVVPYMKDVPRVSSG